MKKLLLLFTLLLSFSIANAQNSTHTFKITADMKATQKAYWTLTENNVTWSFNLESYTSTYFAEREGGTTEGFKFGSAANPMKSVKIATDAFNGKKIVSIVVNAAKNGANATPTVTAAVNGVEATAQDVTATTYSDFTFEINQDAVDGIYVMFSNSNTATGKANKNGGAKFHSIKVTFTDATGGDVTTVTMPVIAMDDKDMVTITTATEGADIYYTIDGSDPLDAASNAKKYEAPFELMASATVKAFAQKGEDKSPVASKDLVVVEKKAALAGWTTWGTVDTYKVTCPLTVAYMNGKNLYVTDGTDYALVFNQNNITLPAYVPGDVINGLSGKLVNYQGQPEIVPSAVGELTSGGEAPTPEQATLADINADNISRYITITNVWVEADASDKNNRTFTISNDDASAVLYNNFRLTNIVGDYAKSITGFITAHTSNSTTVYQLAPIAIEMITTGVEEIEAADSNAPVEYYNLQGVRIDNPAQGGLYIKKQGNTISKIIIR